MTNPIQSGLIAERFITLLKETLSYHMQWGWSADDEKVIFGVQGDAIWLDLTQDFLIIEQDKAKDQLWLLTMISELKTLEELLAGNWLLWLVNSANGGLKTLRALRHELETETKTSMA